MASVSAKKVFKNYGDVAVVHGIDLDIEDGSFVVLLGPSGCGKSTLLRMIAGLETVTKGDIEIAGKRVNDVHPKDRNIAMVFQNYALYAHMNVADNMSFSLKLAKRPQSEVDQKVSWAAKILNLEPYLKRYPRELSGGQRQRVAMGRAIVRDPAVFLFDEPLSNLDAKLRVQMRTEIKELHERLKTTTVYVTHDQIEAMTMADRIVILRDGRIEQIGSPLEVYDRPVNLFVATFIGSPAMNLLKGEVVGKDNGVVVKSGGVTLPLPKGVKAEAGQKVIYGVRPEHFDPIPGKGGIPATISVVEPTGPEIHIYAELAGELAVRRQTGIVITSRTQGLAQKLCDMLATDYYHPRVSDDMAGVELCAAFKNFFAISVGWAQGQHEKAARPENNAFNFNAASIIFDQAIAEMMVLARFLGGEDQSVWGMPGAGDLYVTCQAGRNSRLGRQLGLGLSYAEVKAGPMKDDTIEGAELGIALASTLKQLMASGKLDAASLPVTAALINSLTSHQPLEMPWSKLHRYS